MSGVDAEQQQQQQQQGHHDCKHLSVQGLALSESLARRRRQRLNHSTILGAVHRELALNVLHVLGLAV
jgi:hypothetical protein